jgi:hypothetical protein
MLLRVLAASLIGLVIRLRRMSTRRLRVMSAFLVAAFFVAVRSVTVALRRVLVMRRRALMMLRRRMFVGHFLFSLEPAYCRSQPTFALAHVFRKQRCE